ncbi:MAG: tetratricopeptide repeat protein [Magnetococcales bacterium]|nr:tetratricopeptide repeat protein [Magnetococcales bacterium]
MVDIRGLLQAAWGHHQAGRLHQAEQLYRQVLQHQPDNGDANQLLGLIALAAGKLDVAETLIKRAVRKNPDNAFYHYHLSNVLLAGKRYEEVLGCCQKVIALEPHHVEALNNMGAALLALGRDDQAIAKFQECLRLKPDFARVICNLGYAMQKLERFDEAVEQYKAALTFDPQLVEAYNNLGWLLVHLGRFQEAVQPLQTAIRLKPDFLEARFNLSLAHVKLDQPAAAEQQFQKAVALSPGRADVQNILSAIPHKYGHVEEMIAYFHAIITQNPQNVKAITSLAVIYESVSRLEEAVRMVAKGLALEPADPLLTKLSGTLARRTGEGQQAVIGRMALLLSEKQFPLIRRSELLHELGLLCDNVGQIDQAMTCFTDFNRIEERRAGQRGIDKENYLGQLSRLEAFYKTKILGGWSPPVSRKDGGNDPVFLFGFPRSGTTLLDRILECHPRFQVLEEKPLLQAVRENLNETSRPYPGQLAELDDEEVERLRKLYFNKAARYVVPREGGRIVDKNPLNTVHIPLILRLFPNAKMVFALRHPLDVCLSCFMQRFGFNNAMANFYTLADTGHFYSRVMGLWEGYVEQFEFHWHSVRYEDLVADFKGETSKLLAFLQVEWDPAVYGFHEHAKKEVIGVYTPSYQQVARPIYDTSRYRWRRYESHLQELKKTIAPFIDRFGYGSE